MRKSILLTIAVAASPILLASTAHAVSAHTSLHTASSLETLISPDAKRSGLSVFFSKFTLLSPNKIIRVASAEEASGSGCSKKQNHHESNEAENTDDVVDLAGPEPMYFAF